MHRRVNDLGVLIPTRYLYDNLELRHCLKAISSMSFSKSIPRDDKELAIDEPSVEEVNPTAHAVDSVTLNRALRKVDYRLLPVLGLLCVR